MVPCPGPLPPCPLKPSRIWSEDFVRRRERAWHEGSIRGRNRRRAPAQPTASAARRGGPTYRDRAPRRFPFVWRQGVGRHQHLLVTVCTGLVKPAYDGLVSQVFANSLEIHMQSVAQAGRSRQPPDPEENERRIAVRWRRTLKTWVSGVLTHCARLFDWLLPWLTRPARQRWQCTHRQASLSRRVFAHPKPKWVCREVIRLKTLMPHAGCRTIAHHFNRRWQCRRQMTVSKTYVADMCRRHQYRILTARRKLKHRIPRPIPRNRIWGCDLLVKMDRCGQPHLALAILDHASRACLRLQRLSDKSS